MLFHEYFHGDTGRGLGASHQTGWTALVTRSSRKPAADPSVARWLPENGSYRLRRLRRGPDFFETEPHRMRGDSPPDMSVRGEAVQKSGSAVEN